MSLVAVERDGPVTRLRLERAEKLNAFSAELVEDLQAALDAAVEQGARLVVFSAAGKGFSGGFDLSGLEEMSDGDLLLRFVRVEELLQAVQRAPVATAAFVHGPCYGAAADLVAACQWRIASPETRFRFPGLRFGIVLGTRRLSNLLGADSARALLLREEPFGAEEALAKGFLQEVATAEDWPAIEARLRDLTLGLDAETMAAMRVRSGSDSGEGDMAALVRSAARGSVKARIQAYLAEMAAKKGR